MVTAKFGCSIEKLRCDNGREYPDSRLKSFRSKRGIQMEFTVPRNPEQNGISERLNRTILDMARCLIFDSGLSKDMWGEAVLTAIYTINRNPTSTLSNGKIPAEIWYGHKVDLTKMRVFGCTAYNHIPKVDRTKLDKRSKMLIMIGYAPNG